MESMKATTRANVLRALALHGPSNSRTLCVSALENRAGRAKQEPATSLNRPPARGAVSFVWFAAPF